jgi:hypothetical protein
MSLRKALVRKEGKLHLKNGEAVLNSLNNLIHGKEDQTDIDITVNSVLIKKIQQMRDMESKLPEAEY